jgi:hypothetical protein
VLVELSSQTIHEAELAQAFGTPDGMLFMLWRLLVKSDPDLKLEDRWDFAFSLIAREYGYTTEQILDLTMGQFNSRITDVFAAHAMFEGTEDSKDIWKARMSRTPMTEEQKAAAVRNLERLGIRVPEALRR